MRGLAIVALGGFLALLVLAEQDLPERGDPTAPAHTHVASHYIERSLPETGTTNLVTAVLADYRGYDTLGETVVIFTAALAITLILPKWPPDESPSRQPGR